MWKARNHAAIDDFVIEDFVITTGGGDVVSGTKFKEWATAFMANINDLQDMLAGALLAGFLLLLPSYKYLLDAFKSQRRRRFSYWFVLENEQPQVVIVGGGFTGMAARES